MNDVPAHKLRQRAEELGIELRQIGDELIARGEVHEARHIWAAVQAANMVSCDETCPLHRGDPKVTIEIIKHTHSRWEDVKARVLGDDPNDARRHQDCMLGDCVVSRILQGAPVPCPHNMPEKTPEMIASGHQVWVWLQRPGRWEIRGTGVVVDFMDDEPSAWLDTRDDAHEQREETDE